MNIFGVLKIMIGHGLTKNYGNIDSRPIEKKLTPKEKKLYLREIKKDVTYFRTSHQRANLQVDISGLDQDQAARKVKEAVEELDGKLMQQARSEQTGWS